MLGGAMGAAQQKSRCALDRASGYFYGSFFGGAVRSRTGLTGFAIRGITALLPRQKITFLRQKREANASPFLKIGAGKESRTLDLNLGKVALYQLSYSRIYYSLTLYNVCLQ